MDSDRASISLCHELDTTAAFARARFAYSLARSLSKFRPVVRTGSISVGRGAWFAENAFMTCAYAVSARRRRSVFNALRAMSNAILDRTFHLACGALILHKLLRKCRFCPCALAKLLPRVSMRAWMRYIRDARHSGAVIFRWRAPTRDPPGDLPRYRAAALKISREVSAAI